MFAKGGARQPSDQETVNLLTLGEFRIKKLQSHTRAERP